MTAAGSTDSMQTRRSQVGNEVQLRFLVDTVKNEATRGNAIVMVMRRFERFTARRKQTLLYNLFDLTQCPDVRIAIVGLSTFHNVTDDFEKRILVSNGVIACTETKKCVIPNSSSVSMTIGVLCCSLGFHTRSSSSPSHRLMARMDSLKSSKAY